MKNRLCLLAVPVVALAAGGVLTSADAAAKKCKIIADDKGDAAVRVLTTGPGAPGSANEDILSGDLASDGKKITGVIRMAALAQPDPQAPLGQGFFIEFAVKGAPNPLFLSARTYPNGTQYVFGYSAPDPNTGINTSYTIGKATGKIDTAAKEVRITAANSAFAPAGTKMPKGAKLITPTAKTYRIAGQSVVPSQNVGGQRAPLGGLLLTIDEATGGSYVVGALSCVRPGA